MTPTDRSGSPLVGDPGRRAVLAVDLGGTQLRAAAVDAVGRLHGRRSVPTPLAGGPLAVVAAARELLAMIDAALPDQLRRQAEAIGVSAPGPLDPRTGTLLEPPNLGSTFDGFPLGERLAEATGRPVFVDRDTQVAALGEGQFGAARGLRDYIYLTVSTGLGGAVVSDGRLLRGPDGTAGELGHLAVSLDGPLCGCGAPGHLEAFSSGTGIAAAAQLAISEGRAPALAEVARRRAPDRLRAVDVAAAEEAGDPVAAGIMELARRAFAAALVGLVNVFDPERIVVGGGVALGQGERLLQPAREAIARHAFRAPAARVSVVAAELGDDVGLIGALALVRDRQAGRAA